MPPPPVAPSNYQETVPSLDPLQLPNCQEMLIFQPYDRLRRGRLPNLVRPGKTEDIPAPYPWATTRRATIHSLQDLLSKGISTITGSVRCKRCCKQFDIEYDLQKKFTEVANFIMENREKMGHSAPAEWMDPTLPDCKFCEHSNCMIPDLCKHRDVNWLFLFLGQMVGCCHLPELKYFCKHTGKHRMGSKDKVLYNAYLELCRQLDPQGSYYK